MSRFTRALLALSTACLSHAANCQDWPTAMPSPTLNHHSMLYHVPTPWDAPLNAMLRANILLTASSSQPKGFVGRLHDGNPGNVDDPTGSFLIFDGPHAAVRIRVPAWRSVDRVDFYTLEARKATRASARVDFKASSGKPRRIAVVREVVAMRGDAAHVRYHSGRHRLALRDGELVVSYDNPDFSSAFVAEIAFDGLAASPPSVARDAAASERIVFWQSSTTAGMGLHSLMLKTADTGKVESDLTVAWVGYPHGSANRPLPLVVLIADPAERSSALELLGFEGRPELAVAPELVRAGLAVLVVDCAVSAAEGMHCARRIAIALTEILGSGFSQRTKLRVDRRRVGLWASGKATAVAGFALTDRRLVRSRFWGETLPRETDMRELAAFFSKVARR